MLRNVEDYIYSGKQTISTSKSYTLNQNHLGFNCRSPHPEEYLLALSQLCFVLLCFFSWAASVNSTQSSIDDG